VFDEATSSLDSNNEKFIQENLKEIFKGKITTIVIAHRLSTIIDSDEIIVLNNGCIVERGTHESLLDLNGEYFNLWNFQNDLINNNNDLINNNDLNIIDNEDVFL
jgi:ABC-type transport system involved in Fe-S cluster assembly fused permease/ATPase subunit